MACGFVRIDKMKHNIALIIILCLSIFTLNACGGGKWESAVKDDYTISYPKNWRLVSSQTSGYDFSLAGPKPKMAILIDVKENPAGTPLDTFIDKEIHDINARFTANMLEQHSIKIDGVSGQQLIFYATRNDKASRINANYLVKNNKIYIISFLTPIELYEKHNPAAQKIINTFTFQ